MRNRKAITIVPIIEKDYVHTFMKPLSNEYSNQLVAIYEDAYGNINLKLMSIDAIKKELEVDDYYVKELIKNL